MHGELCAYEKTKETHFLPSFQEGLEAILTSGEKVISHDGQHFKKVISISITYSHWFCYAKDLNHLVAIFLEVFFVERL